MDIFNAPQRFILEVNDEYYEEYCLSDNVEEIELDEHDLEEILLSLPPDQKIIKIHSM